MSGLSGLAPALLRTVSCAVLAGSCFGMVRLSGTDAWFEWPIALWSGVFVWSPVGLVTVLLIEQAKRKQSLS